ncbi:hypothetical protein K8I85_02895 [bacterium]|nr:hypothetical protein [bacterium]
MLVRKWRRSAARIVVATGLAGMLAGCAGKGDGSGSGAKEAALALAVPEPQAVSVEGITNAKALGNDLLFAGQPTEGALRALAGQGYRTVVNMRGVAEMEWNEQALVESLGMTYLAVPMPYPIEKIDGGWVEEFDALMAAPDARPMLIHCSSGNRVGGLYGVWLAERKGLGRAQALDRAAAAGMTRIRPVVEKRLAGH